MAESTGDAITQKIGPLPAWAWAGTVVVLILLFRHFHSAADPTTVDPNADPGTDLTDPSNDPSQAGDPFAGGGFTGSTGDVGSVGTDPTDTGLNDVLGAISDTLSGQGDTLSGIGDTLTDIQGELDNPPDAPKPHHTTKAQWATNAVKDVTGNGHHPVEVETALWKYLHHKPLTKEERAIVNQAIHKNGPPPGGPIAVVHLPNPHPPKPVGKNHKPNPPKKAAKKPAKKKPPHRKAS